MARPTLVSLAKELGVSRQTVSNVINAPHLVRPETRARVEAAIKESGYRPNVVAQALRSQRSQVVAVRVYPSSDGINGTVMDRFLHHLVLALKRHGYRLTLLAAADFEEEARLLVDMHDRGTIDGAILTDSHAADDRQEALVGAGVPTATFGRPWGAPKDAAGTWVDVDGAAGTRAATEALLARGHTRIGFLGWPPGSEVGEDRRRGWLEAMARAGLAEKAGDWQANGDDRMVTGMHGMEALLARGVEAVVCSSDSLAVGALETLRRAGRLTGQWAPVVGFDNTPVSRALGFSSIDQPVERVVDALCAQLARHLEDPAGLPHDAELLAPTLVERSLGALFNESADPASALAASHN